MIKIQAFIVAFALLILGYTVTITGEGSRTEGYYLTVGERGIAEITYATPGNSGGCVHADGSLFRKGERVWLEVLDGKDDLEGLTVSALDENGKVCWSADFEDGRAAVYEKNGWKIIREGG